MCVHCQGHPDSPDSPDSPDTRQCSTGPTPPTAASDRGRCKRGPSCPYISAQSPSPRMFLKNLRQRIVQYYIKIEPCHAKVFRPTMVQRHIRDRANADSAVCTPKHQTMLYMSAQSPSPWTFLTNLRQRIVQNYTKIEPGYAKVFRPTMVQRHIREWPDSGPTVARQWPDSGPTAPDRARHPDSQGSNQTNSQLLEQRLTPPSDRC